ncbi:MAG: hypothetical protein M3299_08395 [Thermoproteota archaeon]|nr:hypothetical protein [Thermoproteota archaeon]
MFESLGRTTKIVIAAIAVSGMLIYAFPAQQLASAQFEETINQDQDLAQRINDETDQRIRQTQEQEQEQEIEQELDQSNEANIDQSEVNNQANVIDTGDNTATTTQIGDNDAIGNALAAEAEGGEGGDSERDSKYYKSSDYSSGSGGSGGDAEAASAIVQEVDNEAETNQDSSADDNVQANVNEFGDDVAVVDQDNVADQTAVNVGLQFQNQEATNEDVNVQYGTQAQDANICDPDFAATFIGGIC